MNENRLQRLLLIALIGVSAGCGKTTQTDAPQTTQDGHSAADATQSPNDPEWIAGDELGNDYDIDPNNAEDNELPNLDGVGNPMVNTFDAKVVGIVDGDTIDILTSDKKTVRVRLNGIDTPERGQPFGNNAKQFLSDSIGGQMVRFDETDQPDRYGRLIGDISQNGQLINLLLVKDGLARHYVKYAPDRDDLAHAEKLARMAKLGLWGGSHQPIAPWEWRKLSKEERDELR